MIPVLFNDHNGFVSAMVCLLLPWPIYLVLPEDGVELAVGFSLASSNELDVSMEDSGSGGVAPFSASQVVMYLRGGVH